MPDISHLATSYLNNIETNKLHDAFKRADGVNAVLFAKGKVKEELGGGDNFQVRIRYGKNPNVGWGTIYGEIDTLFPEAKTMATVPQKFIRGSIPLNIITLQRAAKNGEWALGDFIREEMQIAFSTYVQQWSTSLRQDAPGANDPLTLLPTTANVANGILAPQTVAAQSATTAGIARTEAVDGVKWWANQYTNTSIDISSEAGRASLYRLLYAKCVFGSLREDEPDFGLTNDLVIGDLGASIDTNKRADYATDALIAKLGLGGIQFYNAFLVRDSSTKLEGKVCFLNSRDLYIKYLKNVPMPSGVQGGELQMADQGNDEKIPVTFWPFQRDFNSPNLASIFGLVAGLVPAALRTHGLADNVV